MLIALSAICLVLFGIAVLAVAQPRQLAKNVATLLHRLRLADIDVAQDDLDRLPLFGSNSRARPMASNLLTKAEVESEHDMSSWQRLAYEDFKTTILAKETGLKKFPCVYATMGYRSDEHRYVFLESTNPAEPRNIRLIGPALQSYLAQSKTLGPNTSLVIICSPSETEFSVTDHNQNFWDMLRGLRIWDPVPWPESVPHATDSEKWTFCFDGQPIFPVMLTPAHTQRWSRHMSVPLIALQPKWVLDELLSTDEKRETATGKVRKLLKEYDQIDISPDLTSYGAPGTTEARQLCLLDQNETASCPYQDLDK